MKTHLNFGKFYFYINGMMDLKKYECEKKIDGETIDILI